MNLDKPCKKCGAVDRSHKTGNCRACSRTRYQNMTAEQRQAKNIYNRERIRKVREINPEYGKEWKSKNSSKIQGYHRKHRYNLTEEQYQNLLNKQGNKCGICKQEVRLVVDHCHTTNKVRGLLCYPCNVGLGYYERLKKSEPLFNATNDYLEKNNE